jgi:hypothetical protein
MRCAAFHQAEARQQVAILADGFVVAAGDRHQLLELGGALQVIEQHEQHQRVGVLPKEGECERRLRHRIFRLKIEDL